MTSLGEFDAAVREATPDAEPNTFVFGGVEFTVAGRIPAILMVQLGAAAGTGVDEVEMAAGLWTVFGRAIGPDRFDEFFQLALERETELEDLMRLAFALYKAQAGRPTKRLPGSSDGPPPTSPNSKPSSTHPALAHLRPVGEILDSTG